MTEQEFKLGLWKSRYRYRIFDQGHEVLGVYSQGKHYAGVDAREALGEGRYTVEGIDTEWVDPFFDWQPLTEFG